MTSKNWRDGKAAKARSARRWADRQEVEDPSKKPPSFTRSRTQLATTYAPGVLFTFEGGRGICRSVPLASMSTLPDTFGSVSTAISEGIKEFVENWANRARNCRGDAATVPLELCIDDVFIQRGSVYVDWMADFEIVNPERVGYEPWPLLYQCMDCGRLREYESVSDQIQTPLPEKCGGHKAIWRQVDVVFAHWSGEIQPLSPWNFHYDKDRGVSQIRQCRCGGTEFRLWSKSTSFSDWCFQCLSCGDQREVVQADAHTLGVLKPRMDAGEQHEWVEINMLPVSYRANSVHYVQSGRFVVLARTDQHDLMGPGKQVALLQEVAGLHGFPRKEPTRDEIKEALRKAGRESDWNDWEELDREAAEAKSATIAKALRKDADSRRKQWIEERLIPPGEVESPALVQQIERRSTWARRFDPLRLTVEHAAFYREHVEAKMQGYRAFDVLNPDLSLCDAAGDPVRLENYRLVTKKLLDKLGVAQMVFIKGLPICEYTFGYSRVSAGPVYERSLANRRIPMPVRLKAFQPIKGKHPVYALMQDNEALYVRLDVERVRTWLVGNGVPAVPPAERSLGAAYLEQYQDFGQFLDLYRTRDGTQGAARSLPAYIYMLLHTLAHQSIHAMAETSGLDLDGIGELIYPADLAFVIYRKGMTPDLGLVSAMWRNRSQEFLRLIGDPRRLRCGSGSLCDARGSACPACIMLPDVTCQASNQLLSRAALAGGRAPMWEGETTLNMISWFSTS